MTWNDVPEPEPRNIDAAGWLRIVLKGVPIAVVVLGGFALLLLLRLIERPVFGVARPVSPVITRCVCRTALWVMGLKYSVEGTPMTDQGAVVANHASWLDIFALNACQRVYFVSKAEVSHWPLIGWMARATGTVFIRRTRRDAANQKTQMEAHLNAGHKLLFFPEGTSSDGLQVLPFKSTLFAAFFSSDLWDSSSIQPATVIYHAPDGGSDRFYGWWGDMEFGPHFLQTLAAAKQGQIEVVFHTPLKVSDFSDRKELAKVAENAVRRGLKIRAP